VPEGEGSLPPIVEKWVETPAFKFLTSPKTSWCIGGIVVPGSIGMKEYLESGKLPWSDGIELGIDEALGGSVKFGLLGFVIGGIIDCAEIYFGNPEPSKHRQSSPDGMIRQGVRRIGELARDGLEWFLEFTTRPIL
jgi:hypothetical protein